MFGTGLMDDGGGDGTWLGLLGEGPAPPPLLCAGVELAELGLGDRLGDEF